MNKELDLAKVPSYQMRRLPAPWYSAEIIGR